MVIIYNLKQYPSVNPPPGLTLTSPLTLGEKIRYKLFYKNKKDLGFEKAEGCHLLKDDILCFSLTL